MLCSSLQAVGQELAVGRPPRPGSAVPVPARGMRAAPPRDAAHVADDASRTEAEKNRFQPFAGAEAEVLLLECCVSVTTGRHIPVTASSADPPRRRRPPPPRVRRAAVDRFRRP